MVYVDGNLLTVLCFIAEVSTRHRERAGGDVAGEIWGSAAQKEADAQGQHTVDTACPSHAMFRVFHNATLANVV